MALTHLSGTMCYWPGCPEPILREVQGKHHFTGEIAHIRAARPDGPRYDATMTDDERRHQKNLMLFYHPHHDIVDNEANSRTYSTELLLRRKTQREADPKQALRRLREVTPAGLRQVVTEGMEIHDIKMLSALARLEQHDHEAATLMRGLVDELTEAYSRLHRTLDPDVVMEFGTAVRTLYRMRGHIEQLSSAASELRRRRRFE